MNKNKLLLLLVIGLSVGAFFYFDLGSYFSLEAMKAQQSEIESFYASNVVLTVVGFFLVYVLVTGLSLPGAATVMTLLAGAVFGLFYGVLIVSFASTMGATIAFLSSLFILKDWAQSKFPKQFETINEGLEKDGAFYLLTLRIVPALPFFVINILMGLTSIPVKTFYWVSQVGMLAGTIVYVNAGTELAKLESLSGILSPSLFGSLVLLGIFPTLAVKFLEWLKSRKVYQGYQKPKTFDANMVVIGAGAAGLVNAYIGSAVKAKVVLIEA